MISTIGDSFLVLIHTPQEFAVHSPLIGVGFFVVVIVLLLVATSGFGALRAALRQARSAV